MRVELLGSVGFAAACLVFAVLAALLAVSWRGKLEGALLVAAAALTSVWGFVLAVQPAGAGPSYVGVVVIIELLRDGAWLLFVSVLLRGARLPMLLTVSAWSFWAVAFAGAIASAASERVRDLAGTGFVLTTAGLLLSILVLVFLEQLYRSGRTEALQLATRYAVVGLAGMFIYDLYVYAQAVLVHAIIPVTWMGRGWVTACAGPLVALSAKRQRDWSVQLYMSRDATFYGAAVTCIGTYLVLMAATGYAINLYGGDWGPLAQLLFLAGAGALLIVLTLSPRVRRDLVVLLNKHFYRSRYDYRNEWLRFAETLSSPRDKNGLREAGIFAVARIVSSPRGLLWVQDEAGEAYEAVHEWPGGPLSPCKQIGKGESCVAFLNRMKWIIDLDQYREQPAIYDHMTLPRAWREEGRRLRLIVPLFLRDELHGFIGLDGEGVKDRLNYEDHDVLKTVGTQIATYLRQDEIQRRLAVAQQFEAYQRLGAFMYHDIKNIVAQQSLLVANAARHKSDPAFIDDAIATIGNSVRRMTRMLNQFRAEEVRAPKRVALWDVLEQSVRGCAQGRPRPELCVEDKEIQIRCDPERLATALEHLIKNAQEATCEDGSVRVSAACADGKVTILVEDDGVGMDEEFIRERLFHPFDSTKGSKGMGIGAYQTREFVRGMGGKLYVQSTVGQGTSFRIELPAG